MNRIRELRKQMDLTQKELAKHLQIADSTLSYWEMGKYEPDNDALMKLSRFFNVPIDYIIGGDFIRWDIDGDRVPYRDADASHLAGSDIFVSESEAPYKKINRSDIIIEPATIDSQLSASAGSSTPDAIKPATPSNTAYGIRSAQAAFNRVEFEGLTQGEIDSLAEYALFIKSRRKKDSK